MAATDPTLAARLLGGLHAVRERTGHRTDLPGRAAFAAPRLDEARMRLGADVWEALVEEGRRLSYDELVALATRRTEPA